MVANSSISSYLPAGLGNPFISLAQYYYFKSFSNLVIENRVHANACQQRILSELIQKGATTSFGREHGFKTIKSYDDFKQQVPLREYEDFKPYIQKIFSGEPSVLWPGQPSFFGKSSGTTDAPKYIPVTNEFINCTQFAAKYMLCNLIHQFKHAGFIGNKVFYLTDQQDFEMVQGFKCGAISEIKSHFMPKWASYFSVPKKEINRIINPVEKIDAIIDTLPGNDIRMAVALPVYLSHFLRHFEIRNGNKFKDVFPNFGVLFVSGMNYEPYENLLRQHLGNELLIMENYSATEGNIAYQSIPGTKGMELICNQGLFYEFIPLEDIHKKYPRRLPLKDVILGKPYGLVISGNNGLWSYKMNDVVEFVSTAPYHLIVSGRLKDIFFPFGEHMLPIQAEQAMAESCTQTQNVITDFMIIPDFKNSTCRYKCFAEFDQPLKNSVTFAEALHKNLCLKNSYYNDLVKTNAVTLPEIIPVTKGFFFNLLQLKHNNISAQQKIVHLVNDPGTIAILENLAPSLLNE